MKLKNVFQLVSVGLFTSFVSWSGSVFAEGDIRTRCKDDKLTTHAEAIGRNAWSVKCGYTKKSMAEVYNEEGGYQVFETGNQPTDPSASCISGLTKLGMCYVGCFTGDQKVMFGGEYIAIQDAVKNPEIKTITTVDFFKFGSGYIADPSSRSEQNISSFIIGRDTKEIIYVLKTETGKTLSVTHTHPIVRGDGEMVKVKTLSQGDFVMNEDGQQEKLVTVQTIDFRGDVFNVEPASKKKEQNVHFAQGLLTGSNRFQSQWADDFYRIELRTSLEVPASTK